MTLLLAHSQLLSKQGTHT